MRRAGAGAWLLGCALLGALACARAARDTRPLHASQPRRPIGEGVCQTMDIRNDPGQLHKLQNCTVIEGRLTIVLIERFSHKHFEGISFPQLREITGYLVMYRVKGLRSLGQLFPNLAVIRGTQLFKDFALVVYDMEELSNLGLKSLTNIERGAVRIERNDRLCYVDTIDWAAIAPKGLNNIIRNSNDPKLCGLCPGEGAEFGTAKQCPMDAHGHPLCWDEKNCQKLCPAECGTHTCMANGTCCDVNCLGGCSGPGSKNCHVCRNYSIDYGENRTCIADCPNMTYKHYNRRCISELECRLMPPPLGEDNAKGHMRVSSTALTRYYKPHQDSCVFNCPVGFDESGEGKQAICKPCPKHGCTRYCDSGYKIESLDAAQAYKGCTHVKGSLEITIRGGGYVMKELEECLGAVQEIQGFLRVSRSFALVTLSFFKSLKRIRGDYTTGATKKQSLFIFDNPNLEELWDWDKHGGIQIDSGKLFIHFNPKLCYSQILPLREMAPQSKFDELEVSKENNGDKAACYREKLTLVVKQRMTHAAILRWNQYCLPDQRKLLGYSIYFTKADHNVTQYERRDACQDVWLVDDKSMDEQQINSSTSIDPNKLTDHFRCANMQPMFHPLTRLEPYTRYAAYVKTYTTLQDAKGAQSPIVYFKTLPGQPSRPTFPTVDHLNPHDVVIKWMKPLLPNGDLIQYRIIVSQDEYHKETIYQNNYCKNPGILNAALIKSKEEPPKKLDEKGKEGNESETCKCPGTTKSIFTDDREAEQLEAIQFENALQNTVYVKTSKIEQFERQRRSLENKLTETYYTDQVLADVKNVSMGGYHVVYAVNVTANVTEVVVQNLRHYTWYTVSLRACRAIDPSETITNADSACSLKATKTYRTFSLDTADIVTSVRAELLPGNKSTPEVRVTWAEPEQPNGLNIAYTVRHARVDNDNIVNAPTSCVPHEDYVRNKRSYLLRNLAPGNYSITVTAVTLAGNGPTSVRAIVYIPDRSTETPTQWILGVIAGCLGVLGLMAGGVWYVRRGLLPPTEANKLFASVNPEYTSTVYVPDEWEVPRDSVELVRELGQGSFGMVYEGIGKNIVKGTPETRCAVKTVNEHATDRERVEFLNEASVMKAFDTWHVVRLLGVVSRGQPTLVIMELMESGDLKSYLRSHRPDSEGSLGGRDNQSVRPPTLTQIQQMAIEIADGMAYLSAKKFVHRDLAARNCMVAGDLTVKVGDFGMTRDIYETDYYRKGSKGLLPVRWMSPESLKDGVFSSSSDVWSFGVVLWEMATLAMQPYQGLSNEQVLRYVVEGGVMERPEHCPDRLYELMRMCWAHRPLGRPSFLWLVASLAPTAAPHFRHRSFFHTPQGQELYAQQEALDDEHEQADVNVGAVAADSENNLFGVTGRLASWVRELSSIRSRASDDAATEPLAPPERHAMILKPTTGPNGVLAPERYTRDPAATSDC